MPRFNRRDFLKLAGAGFLTPYIVTYQAHAQEANQNDSATPFVFEQQAAASPERVFGLSIASGDPTPTGLMLWTRINPQVWQPNRKLVFEVAENNRFKQVVVRGEVDGTAIGPEHDYTVKIDLDGRLQPNRSYYYRFIYNKTASRSGRCRTLPAPGEQINRVRFAVLTCQDYTNGYYGAFARLTQEAEIDFVLHLGDFIYEAAGDSRYQALPYPDREIILPSGQQVAFDLTDYRFLYRTYRSDRFLQAALERYTFINIWDDHETANDTYWDYERDTLGAPDHPFTNDPQYGNDPLRLNQLKLDAMRAWAEYVPARVQVNENATRPHDYYQIQRQFAFGNLVDLFVTDERTYRSPHPCGEDDYGERYGSPGCAAQQDPTRTMLGSTQRDWLVNGLRSSGALWRAWGNQVFQGAFRIGAPDLATIYLNLDAWDGYEYERTAIMQQLAGLANLIVLTGDLHSYIASYLKVDYVNPLNIGDNVIGVEFMTPAVTSANFKELVTNATPTDTLEEEVLRAIPPTALTEPAIRAQNPHIHFFNSDYWGYAVVEFNRTACEYTAYAIDKSLNSADAPKTLLRRLRVPVGQKLILDA